MDNGRGTAALSQVLPPTERTPLSDPVCAWAERGAGYHYSEGTAGRAPTGELMSRFQIVTKRALAPTVTLLETEAPRIARKAAAGHFVVVRVDEQGERVPLTIADKDPDRGTITVVFQQVGHTTQQIAESLFLSVRTVETYKLRGMEKLGLTGRAALVRYALENGLLEPGE